ncbi:hypothetical protein [Clostridium intestinale]|uniref:Uncharacterized protein n=1 Tax=Clostridium intestinale DSM 6191 TaxID=1121320 RepID=A0A1M5WAW5_9CLOT|nr:hypothetical protein [Clostridium intestinale]SHH84626.1 hypothetical protein SAMN02745941_01005 [Clostridium intestinale DSM 6191]
MIKNKRDVIIQVIATVILIVAAYLPDDRYILKGAGLIVFLTVSLKDEIKDRLTRGNRKDITILAIAFMIFCVVMVLPIRAFPLRFIGIFLFFIAMYKDNMREYLQRFRRKKS